MCVFLLIYTHLNYRTKSNQRWMKLRTTVQISSAIAPKKPPLKREDSFLKRFSTRQIQEPQVGLFHSYPPTHIQFAILVVLLLYIFILNNIIFTLYSIISSNSYLKFTLTCMNITITFRKQLKTLAPKDPISKNLLDDENDS